MRGTPVPPGPTPLWGPSGVPGEWADPKMSGKYGCTVRSPSPYNTLGLKEADQSCHHVVWMHLSLMSTLEVITLRNTNTPSSYT